MNVRTTLLLVLLVAAGAGVWFFLNKWSATTATSKTLAFLDHELKPGKLTRIELVKTKGGRFRRDAVTAALGGGVAPSLGPVQAAGILASLVESAFILERAGEDWSLPGQWPVRSPETEELINTLTIQYNRSRQAAITTELIEIIAGAEAL